MLPLEIIKGAKKTDILVELKNGDSVKGNLENVDNFMNLKLKHIIYTSSEGDNFFKISEGFIRGNNINSIQLREGLLEKIQEDNEKIMTANLHEITTTSRNIITVDQRGRDHMRGYQRGRGGLPSRGHRGRGQSHSNCKGKL